MHPAHTAAIVGAALAFGCARDQPERLQSLLLKRDFAAVERRLAEAHQEYAKGSITDIELRLRYRALDGMPPRADTVLDEWVRSAPDSYYALSARGYHHRSVAFAVRGNGWAKDVRNWDFIQGRLKLAERDMLASLPLSPQPLMSHYVLLDVAGMPCHREQLARYFEGAVSSHPRSSLLYNRQLHYLKPRWCGSREQMSAHVARAKREGLQAEALQQLAAIGADDEGRALLEQERWDEATQRLVQAAHLGEPFGWAFRRESLFAVNEYSCKLKALSRFCRP